MRFALEGIYHRMIEELHFQFRVKLKEIKMESFQSIKLLNQFKENNLHLNMNDRNKVHKLRNVI